MRRGRGRGGKARIYKGEERKERGGRPLGKQRVEAEGGGAGGQDGRASERASERGLRSGGLYPSTDQLAQRQRANWFDKTGSPLSAFGWHQPRQRRSGLPVRGCPAHTHPTLAACPLMAGERGARTGNPPNPRWSARLEGERAPRTRCRHARRPSGNHGLCAGPSQAPPIHHLPCSCTDMSRRLRCDGRQRPVAVHRPLASFVTLVPRSGASPSEKPRSTSGICTRALVITSHCGPSVRSRNTRDE
ncbi:hypothetical protein C8Q76DRAFT_308983 [Earliella scabrosa]|nr:hypothetical protein C8Q76DRAFT_308983 [Earliella scabrosa]